MTKKVLFFLALSFVVFSSNPSFVLAQACDPASGGPGCISTTDPTPRALCPEVQQGWQFEESLGIPDFGVWNPDEPLTIFLWFFYAAMALAAVLAVTMLAAGGIRYVGGAGNASQQGQAKQWIWNAVLGLVLVLSSLLILRTINPDLTVIELPDYSEAVPDLQDKIDQIAAENRVFCDCLKTAEDPATCQPGLDSPSSEPLRCVSGSDGSLHGCGAHTVGEPCRKGFLWAKGGHCTLSSNRPEVANYCECI